MTYQDLYRSGSTVERGERECEGRYQVIRNAIDVFQRPITVLDLGAAQGYFSFRIAEDYEAVCVMVESVDGQTLANSCRGLDNVVVLGNKITAEWLEKLADCEHFDVILVLNILHHVDDPIRAIKAIERMCDMVIVETPPSGDTGACGQIHLAEIEEYVSPFRVLGESMRHTSNLKAQIRVMQFEGEKTMVSPYWNSPGNLRNTGHLVIETDVGVKRLRNIRKQITSLWCAGINLQTFLSNDGLYPSKREIACSMKSLLEQEHNDMNVWNIILHNKKNGCGVTLIDFDDETHYEHGTKDRLKKLIDKMLL